jgi:hypothetical protein
MACCEVPCCCACCCLVSEVVEFAVCCKAGNTVFTAPCEADSCGGDVDCVPPFQLGCPATQSVDCFVCGSLFGTCDLALDVSADCLCDFGICLVSLPCEYTVATSQVCPDGAIVFPCNA